MEVQGVVAIYPEGALLLLNQLLLVARHTQVAIMVVAGEIRVLMVDGDQEVRDQLIVRGKVISPVWVARLFTEMEEQVVVAGIVVV
jgi:hypothetical protein